MAWKCDICNNETSDGMLYVNTDMTKWPPGLEDVMLCVCHRCHRWNDLIDIKIKMAVMSISEKVCSDTSENNDAITDTKQEGRA